MSTASGPSSSRGAPEASPVHRILLKMPAAKPEPIDVSDADNGDADVKPVVVPDSGSKRAMQNGRNGSDAKDSAGLSKATRVQDDWQVAYVWAFIVKFGELGRIRRLECLEEPDDVFEGILVRFLANLRPGLRNLDCTNIQQHLSNHITDMLLISPEFTVWDRGWPANEEGRAGCCTSRPDRAELGRLRAAEEEPSVRAQRNPIKQAEERGGGLFELDWRQRAALLRQLVDWQLGHSEAIRSQIFDKYRLHEKSRKGKGDKDAKGQKAQEPDENPLVIEPLGMDRNKQRIWSLDSRLYRSGNPFKRPSPLVAISSTRAELEALVAQWEAGEVPAQLVSGAGKAKTAKSEAAARRKLARGIEDEKALAREIRDKVIPQIEREEARVVRQRRKAAEATRLAQQAEVRATRTRRTTRKVDYVYDFDTDDEDRPRRGRGRGDRDFEAEEALTGKPVIPGERRSTRVAGRANGHDEDDEDESAAGVGPDDGASISSRGMDDDDGGPRKKAKTEESLAGSGSDEPNGRGSSEHSGTRDESAASEDGAKPPASEGMDED